MAAEVIADAGHAVRLFDAMPSVGRKFLLAGVGGMNITHSESLDPFLDRYLPRSPLLAAMVRDFDNEAMRGWIHDLGVETFVGSSGRVFPREMKAAPLLRAWLSRLRAVGVDIHTRHRWTGWNDKGQLTFENRHESIEIQPAATVLALGGASWPRLGSDGSWVPWLLARDVDVSALKPSNSGFECNWSDVHKARFAGQPVKNIGMRLQGEEDFLAGEFLLTEWGLEGNVVYALSAAIRDRLLADPARRATIEIDLLPNMTADAIVARWNKAAGKRSVSERLRRSLNLGPEKVSLLREAGVDPAQLDGEALAAKLKCLPLILTGMRPIAEAISSAGGVSLDAVDDFLQLKAMPGVFCAGEMLDWEAPTGGYLLTACFATGRRAGQGVASYLSNQS